jgi:hypothetical protein
MEIGMNFKTNFVMLSFLFLKKAALRREILNFEQKEKETLGAAWARFMSLTNSGPTLSMPKNILLEYFCHTPKFLFWDAPKKTLKTKQKFLLFYKMYQLSLCCQHFR